MIGLAPAVTMIASQSTVGDFDIQLQRRDAKDTISSGNKNFYTDQLDLFSNGLNSTSSGGSYHEKRKKL